MIIDMNNKWIRWIAPTAVVASAAAGLAMNWQFGYSLGSTPVEKHTLGVLSVAFDTIKIFALAAAMAALAKKLWVKGITMIAVWIMVLFYGLTSAIGFVFSSRTAVVAERIQENMDYKSAVKELARLQTELEVFKKAKTFDTTTSCLEPKTNAEKNFCGKYWLVATAIDSVKPQTMGYREQDIDPQLTAIQLLFGKFGANPTKEDVGLGMSIFLAVLVELISSVGLYGFSKSRKPYEFKTKDDDEEASDEPDLSRAVIVDAEGNVLKRPPGRPAKNPLVIVKSDAKLAETAA